MPSYLVNLLSGASGYPFPAFLALFGLSRLIRFAALALALHFFGDTITRLWGRLPARLRQTGLAVFLLGITAWSVVAILRV